MALDLGRYRKKLEETVLPSVNRQSPQTVSATTESAARPLAATSVTTDSAAQATARPLAATVAAPMPAQPVEPSGFSLTTRAPVVVITPSARPANIEEALLRRGVKERHVRAAADRKRVLRDKSMQDIVRDMGIVSVEDVAIALSEVHGYKYFSPNDVDYVPLEAIEKYRDSMPQKYPGYVPVGINDRGGIVIAIGDIGAAESDARNHFHTDQPSIMLASDVTIQRVFQRYYAKTEVDFFAAIAVAEKKLVSIGDERNNVDAGRLLMLMLRHASYRGASDIYLSESGLGGMVSLKRNGVSDLFCSLRKEVFDVIFVNLMNNGTVSSEAVQSGMPQEGLAFKQDDNIPKDIAEEFKDIIGRYTYRMEIAKTPTCNAVIRINDGQSAIVTFENLGFDDETTHEMRRLAKSPDGLVLVTGPTGSGKTTTLYAWMNLIDPIEKHVITVENPIEYRKGTWIQHQIRSKDGEEGAAMRIMVKALLRQAPDVTLVGELRDDPELVQHTLALANTGHLTFSTLHTNSAPEAVLRLSQIGVSKEALATTLKAVLAQRLVRKLCEHCKVPDDRGETLSAFNPYDALKKGAKTLFKASDNGCPHCEYTSYRGRAMLYELMLISSEISGLIEDGAPVSSIKKVFAAQSKTIWQRGLEVVASGGTSIDELRERARP